MNLAINCILTFSKILYVCTFHIPNLTIDTDVSVEDDHSNHGLINSAIINNWEQSLNVGSVSIGSCILLLLLGLILYLKLADKIAHAEQQILKSMKDIKRIQDATNSPI